MKKIIIFILFLLVSCSKVESLNLKHHRFNIEPHKIVWLQIAGFDYRQIPLIRFSRSHSIVPSSLEKFDCIGGMWSYNLTKLRPLAQESFWAQLTGKSNIQQSCFNAQYPPLWSFLSPDTSVGIFETKGAAQRSLVSIFDCPKHHSSYDHIWLWRMENGKEKKKQGVFHYLDRGEVKLPGIYYDRSCGDKTCYSSFYSNIVSLFERFSKDREKYVFIVRDFSYADALAKHSVASAREILSDLEKIVDYFFDSLNLKQDTLFLITGAATKRIETPPQGYTWKRFIEQGKGVLFHRDGLTSVALAVGVRAENFCGIYEESDLLKRFLFTPKQPQGIEKLFSTP